MKKTTRLISAFTALVITLGFMGFFGLTTEAARGNYDVSQYKITGDQRADIVGIARTQLDDKFGTKPSVGATELIDKLPYMKGPWCAHFVAWCAKQAKIGENVLLQTTLASPKAFGLAESTALEGAKTYTYKNMKDGIYLPQSGDLVFYASFSTSKQDEYTPPSGRYQNRNDGEWHRHRFLHVGIIEKLEFKNNRYYLTTIEGNTSDPTGRYPDDFVVARKVRRINNTRSGFLYYDDGEPFYVAGFSVPCYNLTTHNDIFEKTKTPCNKFAANRVIIKTYAKPTETSETKAVLMPGSSLQLVYKGQNAVGETWYVTSTGDYVKDFALDEVPTPLLITAVPETPFPEKVFPDEGFPLSADYTANYFIENVSLTVTKDGVTVTQGAQNLYSQSFSLSSFKELLDKLPLEKGLYTFELNFKASGLGQSFTYSTEVLPKPFNLNLLTDKESYEKGETGEITVSAEEATNFTLTVETDSGEILSEEDLTPTLKTEFTFNNAGLYTLRLTAKNDYSTSSFEKKIAVNGINYTEKEDGTLTLDSLYGTSETVTLPSEIDGKTVTEISSKAFKDRKEITEILIPETVKTIGSEAFSGTSLFTVTLPKTVETIGENAFEKTVILFVEKDSSAFRYAEENGLSRLITDKEGDFTLGDINSDGLVNLSDGMTLLNLIAKNRGIPKDSLSFKAADVIVDNETTLNDAMQIILYVAKKIDTLEPEKPTEPEGPVDPEGSTDPVDPDKQTDPVDSDKQTDPEGSDKQTDPDSPSL